MIGHGYSPPVAVIIPPVTSSLAYEFKSVLFQSCCNLTCGKRANPGEIYLAHTVIEMSSSEGAIVSDGIFSPREIMLSRIIRKT